MSIDSLPPLNLTTAALLIFAVCAGFVLLRGIARMLLGTLIWGASAWFGFYVWQQAPAWSVHAMGKSSGLITTGLPVLAFFLALLVLQKSLSFITRPFVRPDDGAPAPFTNVPTRIFFALISAAVLWFTGAALVHHAGSIAELRNSVEKSSNIGSTSAYLQRMKASVEAVIPASWLKMLDPLAEPGRLALAKLIATQSAPSCQQEIDPKTGKPYPRAIVVDDATLQALARDKDYSTLLRHPNLGRALNDPKVKNALNARK